MSINNQLLILINFLTISRILFAFFIFILITVTNNFFLALLLFIIAGFTDYLDGYLARKYKLESDIGEILDPIADKILIIFILISLTYELSSSYVGFLSSIIISREIFVAALRDINSRKNNTIATKVSYLAKIKTTIQLLTISIYLLALLLNNNIILVIADIFLLLAAIVTIYTGIQYLIKTFKF